jgi:hypothetical protein
MSQRQQRMAAEDEASLSLEGSQFRDESVHPTDMSRSGSRASRSNSGSGPIIGFGKAVNNKEMYGSQGDLLWKALVVTLLVLIGTAAGFVFLYGLIEGDVETTNLVSLCVCLCLFVWTCGDGLENASTVQYTVESLWLCLVCLMFTNTYSISLFLSLSVCVCVSECSFKNIQC